MRSAFACSVLLAFAALVLACERAPARPDAAYRVRGQVVALHGEGEDARVTVAHEAMPEFEDRAGTASGMPAMKMAFGLGERVDAKTLVPGSKWALRFEVFWNREPALRIVATERLPDDTQLVLPIEEHAPP